ncbi:MAG: nucleotidyltransferase family protein, partial [Clostridia bacterium]|nr:nucleotidyltransferase family protein [Clostridia bacterium]
MRIAGIIAEYDPFHNGHAALIASTRAENGGNATHIVTVISGNFTQRGEPALLGKFDRAKMALECGADLVLELPLPWAMSPAESFAAGGVAVLNALGCVHLLSFGSECGDTTTLKQLADLSQAPAYQSALREQLEEGVPYAAAAQSAAERVIGKESASAIASPNNTLAIEYIRAIKEQKADWDVFTLQRQGALHNEPIAKDAYASASMLRKLVREDNLALMDAYMPAASAAILKESYTQGRVATENARLEAALIARLRCMSVAEYINLPWLSEGLENRLYRESRSIANYDDLLTALKTRRYPMARLRRVLWSALIGLNANDVSGLPPYIRVLGMNEKGREILSVSSPALPLVSRATQIQELDDRAKRVFALECVATDLHALAM